MDQTGQPPPRAPAGLLTRSAPPRFSISLGTVKAHLSSVQTKLVARNRVEVVAWAWESGQVRAPGP